MILKIALDAPLRRVFDYLPPRASSAGELLPGVRVRVPFGRRRAIGVLIEVAADSQVASSKLKCAVEIVDREPVFDPATFEVLRWAADYYHHPIGEVLAAALPPALRTGAPAELLKISWLLTPAGRAVLCESAGGRAPRRRALLARLDQRGADTARGEAAGGAAAQSKIRRAELRALEERGLICASREPAHPIPLSVSASEITPTDAQREVIAGLAASLGRFGAHLLYGVTGSGKTEVYLQVISAALADGGQVLVLVPEIALTPQLVERFEQRFSAGIVVLHSALSAAQRRDAWRAAHSGEARIIIGTRSAVFTSLKALRLIVVDEEHDGSYKQQEGFRYSARDLAVRRAQRAHVPVILGSATPSLETLDNVARGRYSRHTLPQRPGSAQPPRMMLIDLRAHPSDHGLSLPAIQAIARHLEAGGQIIAFLNRRGYAPALFCDACGWIAPCAHCDARMTLHRRAGQLRCHHCGAQTPVPTRCGQCHAPLSPVGQGTERIEETLARLFPDAPLARLDRDTVGARGAMQSVLNRVQSGDARILIGTQMLTKGHHFPDVSLVVILDADQGLFASDFRATERLAQTILQVAGRAGRAARAGEVIVQTSFPEHPLLTRLISEGYEAFAGVALEERRAARWPPYSRLALLRAQARDPAVLGEFLTAAAEQGRALANGTVAVRGPATALMARRADQHRAHLLIESDSRAPLQRFLRGWIPRVESLAGSKRLRWSIDVDPLEVD
ncbi:MAG TPA: primosomal protein N' [Steroidobacteraceae bacterium]|nr:primosomal protein N' [Steroidobacteraceae bacterium]